MSRYVSHCGLLFTTCVLELMRFARDGLRAIHIFIDAEMQARLVAPGLSLMAARLNFTPG